MGLKASRRNVIYGVGYKGGKQRIADDILSLLPDGERFVDLFGGGFAMSHAAYLSGKFRKVLYCDNEPMIVQLIRDGISGKYNPSVFVPAWVSRERFHELKKNGCLCEILLELCE
jgi:hypothetical protein